MSYSILKRDTIEVFDKATNLDIIEYNLNNLDNNFEYLFLTIPFSMYNVDWRLPINIDKS